LKVINSRKLLITLSFECVEHQVTSHSPSHNGCNFLDSRVQKPH
jgi:hypothetical protein